MRRAIAMTAVAVALGLALTGCRGGGGRDAQSPVRPDTAGTVSTPAAPAPQETAPADPAAAAGRADQDIAELDRLLGELDGQLKKAEESPNDED